MQGGKTEVRIEVWSRWGGRKEGSNQDVRRKGRGHGVGREWSGRYMGREMEKIRREV